MKIKAINSETRQLKEYDLETLTITGNTADESETTIILGKTEADADIYTSDNCYLTKFKKLIEANPDKWRIHTVVERRDGTISGVMVKSPKKSVSFRSGKDVVREYTDEQMAMLKERLVAANNKRRS